MNKLMFVVLFSFIITFFSCKENTVTSDSTGTITGSVATKSTLLPIKLALISTNPATETILSDSAGQFQLSNLPAGEYVINAEKSGYYKTGVTIKVVAGQTSRATILLPDSIDNNHAPLAPSNPSPSNNSVLSKAPEKLSWSCSDPDGNQLIYTLFLGTMISKMVPIATDITDNYFYPENLNDSTDYYWKVIAKDKYGATTDGDVWKFTTKKTNIPDPDVKGYTVYLPFNGNVQDQSSNGYHGIATNMSYCTDRFGNPNSAAFFNGNGFVDINYSTIFNLTNGMTFSFWIKPDLSYAKPWDNHIDLMSVGNTSSKYVSIYMGITTGYGLELWNAAQNYIGQSSPVSNQKWYHIAFTVQNSGGAAVGQIYVDGTIIVEGAMSFFQTTSNMIARIGRRIDNQVWYGGGFDDLYIFNRVLTSTEIAELAKK